MMDGSSFLASFSTKDNGNNEADSASSKNKSDEVVVKFNPLLNSFPIDSKAENVRLVPFATGSHDVGSSHVRLSNIVNYVWSSERSVGNLVSAHRSGRFLAYGLLPPNGKGDSVVRVWDKNKDERALLKGMKGPIKDIAFSHARDQVILGCVDERGSLFVFQINQNATTSALSSKLLLEVKGEGPISADDYHRLIWCPYLPDEDEDDEGYDPECPSRLLVLTRNNVAEIWNVSLAAAALGSPGPHESVDARAVNSGRLVISEHKAAITAASFSPDGTALAIASLDGQVKFFQVYLASQEIPRCLHEWAPHGGSPVSSLMFLDNLKEHSSDVQFWKYAVTGANNDSELMIWSCESWTCLQTIRLDAPKGGEPSFKAFLDTRAQFLLLSDLVRKSIYVLQLHEGAEDGPGMRVVSASEFNTPCTFLSLAVLDAGVRKVDEDGKTSSDLELNKIKDEPESSEDDDFGDHHVHSRRQYNQEATVIDMVIVQPKSFQRCKISYEDAWQKMSGLKAVSPTKESVPALAPVIKQEPADNVMDDSDIQVSRVLKNTVLNIKPESSSSVKQSSNLESLLKAAAASASANNSMSTKDTITLMSPDSFTASDDSKQQQHRGEKSKKQLVKDEPLSEDEDSDDPVVIKDEIMLDDSEDVKPVTLLGMAARSGNSSPSREVQDILGDSETQGGLGSDFAEPDNDDSLDEEDEVDEDDPFQESSQELESSEEEEKVQAVAPSAQQQSWPKSVPQVPTKQSTNANVSSSGDNTQLLRKLSEMTVLLHSQKNSLQSLRDDVKHMKQTSKQNEKRDADMAKKRDQALQETLKREMDLRNAVLQQQMQSGLHKNLEKTVRDEVRKTMENSQRTLSKQMQTMCAASEKQVMDSMQALFSSKQFLDSVTRPVGDRVGIATQTAVKEQMTTVIAPVLERAFNEIIKQTQGALQCSVQDTARLSQQQADAVLQEVRQHGAEATKQKQQQPQQLQAFIKTELESQFGRLAATLSSGDNNGIGHLASASSPGMVAASPNSRDLIMQTQQKIKQLLAEGATNNAFQTALSANNLQLVLATCEMVNPANLFQGSVCPLTQTVLLSLLQQLGHNLDQKTELKLKYLQEGVICLDRSDPVVQQHMHPILQGLQEQVAAYVRNNPDEADSKQFKLFVMAIQSLVRN